VGGADDSCAVLELCRAYSRTAHDSMYIYSSVEYHREAVMSRSRKLGTTEVIDLQLSQLTACT